MNQLMNTTETKSPEDGDSTTDSESYWAIFRINLCWVDAFNSLM